MCEYNKPVNINDTFLLSDYTFENESLTLQMANSLYAPKQSTALAISNLQSEVDDISTSTTDITYESVDQKTIVGHILDVRDSLLVQKNVAVGSSLVVGNSITSCAITTSNIYSNNLIVAGSGMVAGSFRYSNQVGAYLSIRSTSYPLITTVSDTYLLYNAVNIQSLLAVNNPITNTVMVLPHYRVDFVSSAAVTLKVDNTSGNDIMYYIIPIGLIYKINLYYNNILV